MTLKFNGQQVIRALLGWTFFVFFNTAYAIPDLSIGPFGPGIMDGTAPFNTDGACAGATATAGPGDDCGDNNNQVRTQDNVIFNWSVAANNFTPGQANLKNVVLEQILTPSATAVVNFPSIPARCRPEGGGGSNPVSSITTAANGDIKLLCNLGEFADGEQTSFSINAKVSGESQNGATFSSQQRIYSLADDGSVNATESSHPPSSYAISARPMADVSISPVRWLTALTERDFGQGLEKFYYSYVNVRIATPQRAGTEAVQQPLNFNLQLTATKNAVNGPDYTNSGFEFYLEQCIKNPSLWSGEVYGDEDYYTTTQPIERKTIDSGSCAYSRSNATATSSAYNITINNADLSGSRFPTQAGGNIDLSAGPYYYVNMRLRYLIPVRVVDNADGTANGSGSIYVSGVLQDFDPVSVSGVPNFGGTDKEPGYNGNPMPDGTKSNNITGPYNYTVTTRGTWSHSARPRANNAGTSFGTFAGSWHSGGGVLPPLKAYATYTPMGNNGSNDLSDPRVCNVFDNTTQKLTDRGNVGATAGTYAYVGTHAAAGFDHTNYIVEYGHVDLSGDDPLDKNADGTPDYNNQTGRYEGKWDAQGLARCDDNATTWHTDPNQVSGGIDEVNIVRVRLKDSLIATVKLGSTQYIRMVTPLEPRNQFHGGPHAGQNIPVGTVLASFGSVRVDEYWSGNWTPNNTRPYKPAPETGNGDGDRVTLARTESYLDSESLTPQANPGTTNSTIAGNQIVWKVSTSIQSLVSDPAQEGNVQIIAELPAEVSYNQSCTANYSDSNGNTGTPASLVKYNTDRNGNPKTGYTQLIWNLGTVTANSAMLPRVICTDSDALAPNFSSVTSYFELRGDTLVSLIAQRSDTHTISLEQVGSIQVSKKADTTLDNKNDAQTYTLEWANFATSFPIAAPTIIDVLSYNGDGNAPGAERVPPTDIDGTINLVSAPVTTWLDGSTPSSSEPAIGIWYYTNDSPATVQSDPDQNSSNWCLQSGFGSGGLGCPADFSGVTAIKFVANYQLEKDGNPRQGMQTKMTLQAINNQPGNVYGNRFTFDSASLPPSQFLRSNSTAVHIASYALGDLIFADTNDNGRYDANYDKPVPDGVIVNLYRADGTLFDSTETGLEKPGRYKFERLDAGDYYIEIPASTFQNGGLLADWDMIVTAPGEDDDKNENEDQDGYKTNITMSDGVRSNIITLSATAPLPGEVPFGNEPLADNTANLLDTTGDDFSNYTLDIGLKPIHDFGDAPITFGTAPHIVTANDAPYLGFVRPDKEYATPHTAGADGDGPDENTLDSRYLPAWDVGRGCVGLLPDGTAGSHQVSDTDYCLVIHATNPLDHSAQVVGWLDFNNDGIFNETNERSTVLLNSDTADDNSQGNLPANSITQPVILLWKNVTSPAAATYLRVRVTDDPDFKHSDHLSATLPARNGEVEDYYLELSPQLHTVSGRVFTDSNVNGINGSAETGIAELSLVLYDTATNTCISTRTNANGDYRFQNVPQGRYQVYEAAQESVPTPQSCDPAQAKDPVNHLSTTDNVSAVFYIDSANISNIDFGDVKAPTFELDNTQTILPNSAVLHPHVFTASSEGRVSFNITAENADPTALNWGHQLLLDNNCDGQLDNGDSVPSASIRVAAGQQICLLNKVLSPANVSTQAIHTLTIQSEFTFGNGSILSNYQQTRQDTTRSLAGTTTEPPTDPSVDPGTPDPIAGEGKLSLVKSVWNVTRNINGAVALPGETLRYTVSYENIGNGPLNELVIYDNVPEFTQMVPNSQRCPIANTPPELPPCATNTDGSGGLSWEWVATDKLNPGSSGSVSYEVTIE